MARTEEKKISIENRGLPKFVRRWMSGNMMTITHICFAILSICVWIFIGLKARDFGQVLQLLMLTLFIIGGLWGGAVAAVDLHYKKPVYYVRRQLAAILDYPNLFIEQEFGGSEAKSAPALDKELVQASLALFAHLIEACGGLKQAPDVLAADFSEARQLVRAVFPDIPEPELNIEATAFKSTEVLIFDLA